MLHNNNNRKRKLYNTNLVELLTLVQVKKLKPDPIPTNPYGMFQLLEVVLRVLENMTDCHAFVQMVSVNKFFRQNFWEERKRWFGHLYKTHTSMKWTMPVLSSFFKVHFELKDPSIPITHFGMAEIEEGKKVKMRLCQEEEKDGKLWNILFRGLYLPYKMKNNQVECIVGKKKQEVNQVMLKPSITWSLNQKKDKIYVQTDKGRDTFYQMEIRTSGGLIADSWPEAIPYSSRCTAITNYFMMSDDRPAKIDYLDIYDHKDRIVLRLPYDMGKPFGWGWMWNWRLRQECLFQLAPTPSGHKMVSLIHYENNNNKEYSTKHLNEASIGWKNYHRFAVYQVKNQHKTKDLKVRISKQTEFELKTNKQ